MKKKELKEKVLLLEKQLETQKSLSGFNIPIQPNLPYPRLEIQLREIVGRYKTRWYFGLVSKPFKFESELLFLVFSYTDTSINIDDFKAKFNSHSMDDLLPIRDRIHLQAYMRILNLPAFLTLGDLSREIPKEQLPESLESKIANLTYNPNNNAR